MQDRYVGDIGDYAKYGLLRSLAGLTLGEGDLSLGVQWHLACPQKLGELERSQIDGMHLGYLDRPDRYRNPDPDLHDQLKAIRDSGARSLAAVGEAGFLGPRARFFAELLDFSDLPANSPSGRQARADRRAAWHAAAIKAIGGSDIVFADPDNGLENGGTNLIGKAGPKFAALNELADFSASGSALVLYQHHPRETLAAYVARRHQALAARLGEGALFCVTVSSHGVRHFFVWAPPRLARPLYERARDFVARFGAIGASLTLA
jgi:hypothetical protein